MLYDYGGNSYICGLGPQYLDFRDPTVCGCVILALWLPAPLYQRGIQLNFTINTLYRNPGCQQDDEMAVIKLRVADPEQREQDRGEPELIVNKDKM